jgi:putative FmdB family regulatory protein
MPIFEYLCKECHHQFESIVNGKAKPVCPACKSRRLEKQLSVFAVNASRDAASAALQNELPLAPCGTCGDPRGPGSCSLN